MRLPVEPWPPKISFLAADAGGEGFVLACVWVARWESVVASGLYFGVTSGAGLLLLLGLVTTFPSSALCG